MFQVTPVVCMQVACHWWRVTSGWVSVSSVAAALWGPFSPENSSASLPWECGPFYCPVLFFLWLRSLWLLTVQPAWISTTLVMSLVLQTMQEGQVSQPSRTA